MIELLLEPLRYEFFVRGLIGLSLIAVLCACVGTFVVLKGLSYIGDAMAHAVFPGIVASPMYDSPFSTTNVPTQAHSTAINESPISPRTKNS